MSAYIVDLAHIDMLVSAATLGRVGWSLYYHNGQHHPTPKTRADKTALGKMLLAENEKSIMYRYPDTEAGGVPLYDRMPGTIGYNGAQSYEYPDTMLDPLDAVSTLKLIECYEYQSCEHPGWAGSQAKAFCDGLRTAMISRLPGYSEAWWEYVYPEGQDPRKDDVPKVISLSDLAR